ncbi:hypothetical protein GCM10010236_46230 [Streptomyces eurythermus]|nr:hypothetical protein GCM10010236_46230 [Streptomyces eurythermus]
MDPGGSFDVTGVSVPAGVPYAGPRPPDGQGYASPATRDRDPAVRSRGEARAWGRRRVRGPPGVRGVGRAALDGRRLGAGGWMFGRGDE